MFNMLPGCLLTCCLCVPRRQGVASKCESSVEVNGKVWRKAEDTTSLKSIFGLRGFRCTRVTLRWCTLCYYSRQWTLLRKQTILCYNSHYCALLCLCTASIELNISLFCDVRCKIILVDTRSVESRVLLDLMAFITVKSKLLQHGTCHYLVYIRN